MASESPLNKVNISQRSLGTASAGAENPGNTVDSVVRKTPANNRAAYNPGGVGNSSPVKTTATRPSTPGRNVVGQKGRTVAGTNKTIRG